MLILYVLHSYLKKIIFVSELNNYKRELNNIYVKKRRLFGKSEDIHIWFKYFNYECFVIEPFGDNSRYWIGPKNPEERFDISNVEIAFKQYHPPRMIKFFGDLVTLNFKSLFRGH